LSNYKLNQIDYLGLTTDFPLNLQGEGGKDRNIKLFTLPLLASLPWVSRESAITNNNYLITRV